MIYKTIDLCAGIGGIRRGFEMTGCFINVLSAEIDPSAALTYEHLFGENPLNDVTSEDFKKKVVSTDYDVLLAGFPCQTFSRVGKKLGFRDKTRGTVFFDIADIISRTNPRAVFLENVENLLCHDHGNTIETIITTLEEELEYRVIGVSLDENGNYEYNRSTLIRNSKDFGVPQNRPRVYIMAFSKKCYGNAIKKLTMQLPERSYWTVYRDVNEIIDDVVDDKYYIAQGYLDTLKRHKSRQIKQGYGFGYSVVNDTDEEHPIAHTILATGGSGKERNLILQPKEGTAGKMLPGKKTCLNSEGIRVMTPCEWGRLQGFVGYGFLDKTGRETFSFPEGLSDTQKYKQFGNSVTIPVIKNMADFMLECFELLKNQQVDVIRALANNNIFFTKRDVMEMLDLTASKAGNLLKYMLENNEIVCVLGNKTLRYVKLGNSTDLPPYSQEEKVVKLAEEQAIITNADVQKSLRIFSTSANTLLSTLVKKGTLKRQSRGKYCLNPNFKN